ncbi:hypothetical protein [Oecophyllibacter saccharovorans]|uniref:Uncharacterized protein n=1 Tax=Oecophyllibacter saccharovorans TaxID=2558360 RepID=A0A506USA1_9PROT|nr:hypothetical protein [Oecophyllibacter saccharovorans]TPW35973.1 hypothetical protein E3202_03395 [Oecophyllibacter saccharovorans]
MTSPDPSSTTYELYPQDGGILQWAGPAESREAALNVLCSEAGGTSAEEPDMISAYQAPINDDDLMNHAFEECPF